MKFIYNNLLFEVILNIDLNTAIATCTNIPINDYATHSNKTAHVHNYKDLVKYSAAVPINENKPMGEKHSDLLEGLNSLNIFSIIKRLTLDLDDRWRGNV